MLVILGLINLTQFTVRLSVSCMHGSAWEWYPRKISLILAGLEPLFIFCGSYIESHGPFVGEEVKLITCYLSLRLVRKDCPFEILFFKGLL